MKTLLDLDLILAPIADDQPAGEDLRYSSTYDEIKEARRADDQLDQGAWQREIKTSDWHTVITLASEALTAKTKDLQIAAWLAEALLNTEGFGGLTVGLKIVNGFLQDYWASVYPQVEDDDLDFRAAPIDFVNDKFGDYLKQIPLTDPVSAHGYSLLHWQQSREVGYEADNRDRYGNEDYNKAKARAEKIAEGKISAEDFDTAVAGSSLTWYESVAADLTLCQEEAKRMDALLDEKFGRQAPSLTRLLAAIEECDRFVSKTLKEKRAREPAPKPAAGQPPEAPPQPEAPPREGVIARLFKRRQEPAAEAESQGERELTRLEALSEVDAPGPFSDSRRLEALRWEEALATLETAGIKEALGKLLHASSSAPSIRERNRYRLLIAKLCLEADRPDLARPIVEELQILIEELHLERWESPLWIAEVLDALYRCLTKGDDADQDVSRTKLLLEKLCTTDVTKAMNYRL